MTNTNPQRTHRAERSGLRAFLRLVEAQLRDNESGRIVYFGTRRHGYIRETRDAEQQLRQVEARRRGRRVEHG